MTMNGNVGYCMDRDWKRAVERDLREEARKATYATRDARYDTLGGGSAKARAFIEPTRDDEDAAYAGSPLGLAGHLFR